MVRPRRQRWRTHRPRGRPRRAARTGGGLLPGWCPGDWTGRAVALARTRLVCGTLATPAATALRGALELVAVVAEARARQPWAARERFAAAAVPLARQTGESNVHWTVFGPTNVMLHAVNVEMTDGDAAEGLRLADRIDATRMPSRERQFTFGLEVARCYDLRRDDAAVLVHLLELEQLAPEDLQHSPLGRELVTSLLGRARPTYRPQATGLAQRLQLL
ncbi:hypothetical protein [Streptomyces microflavus]|uniref:hypothetical protein n=1 Tax=Streptomyces microflavus TaxID=1919 RepID=UPI00340BECC8